MQGQDSTKNLLTIENDIQEGAATNVDNYGMDNGAEQEEMLAE